MKKAKVLGIVLVVAMISTWAISSATAQPVEVDMGELMEGDLTNDNMILLTDFNLFKTNYPCFAGCNPEDGDFDRSGQILLSDFNIFKDNYPQFGINEI
jgi:hypothetical protein